MIYADYAPIYEAMGQGAFAETLLRRALADLPTPPRRALDLACGTGAATLALAAAGVDVVGVDRSPQMLAIAQAKARDRQLPARFVEADLRALPGVAALNEASAFDLITCFYDSLNYLIDAGDLELVFAAAARVLVPEGRLLFDLNTAHEFATWRESDQVVHDADGLLVYNRLAYAPHTRLATGRIVWFVRDGTRWWRGEETHIERAWDEAELLAALHATGLRLLARHTPEWMPAPSDAPRVVYEVVRA
jgi:SAM-dependent methyltransferase